jgi:MFS family permease
MPVIPARLTRFLRAPQPVPEQYRRVFLHLFFDIGWFGIVNGTTIAFLAVYATRQGASPVQIGLLSAIPGLITLLFALPAGNWLSHRPMGRAVFWVSVLTRVFYIFLVPLPMLLAPHVQVWAILLITLVMTIPFTALVVGFNSLFAEAVPAEWRGYVAGVRNAINAVVATIFTLLAGQILDRVAFPTGYQIVFGMGVIGAGMSSLHLYLLSRLVATQKPQEESIRAQRNGTSRRLAEEARAFVQRGLDSLRIDVMRGSFARLMALLFCWHLAQFMTIPIITPFVVNLLHVPDRLIAVANSLFNVTVFLGSLQLGMVTARFGNKRLVAVGIMGLSLFPILTAFGQSGYLLGNFLGGFAWALVGGAMFNLILERSPVDDRPAHVAWYNLVANAAILLGSLVGPAVADGIGFPAALLLFGLCRFLAGAALYKWG